MRNQVPPSRGVGTRWRFAPRDWSLRVKFAVVLLVPGLLAVILVGVRIADQTSQAAELDRVERFASAQSEIAALVERLARERYLSTVFVAEDRAGDVVAVETAFAEVDATREDTRPAVEDLYEDNTDLIGVHRQAEQALARLPQLRDLVLQSNAPASAAIVRYSELIAQLVQLNDTVLRGVNTTEVSGLANGLAGLAAARNEASLQLALVAAAANSTEAPAASLAELQASNARLETGLGDFRAALDAGQRVRFGSLIAGAANTDRDTLLQGLLAASGTGSQPDSTPARASAVYDAFLAEIDAAESGVRDELVTTSAARRQTAVNLAGINAVVLLVALLIGATVVGLIARGMIRSLRTLRRSALDVADRRLPDAIDRMKGTDGHEPDLAVEPVGVDTREEVGEVARAFDAVHGQAVRLAGEQALLRNNVNDIFVNLSRRSQGLVQRQLRLIDELENGEQDPEQLGNLFQLDHLATRMRRNSENLLVLAGAELRQRSGTPVAALDVLRAAVSEVEDYPRVVVKRSPPVSVAGLVVNDLVHLVAELLDNATSYSPPDTKVVLSSEFGEDGSLHIEITDVGVGIEREELDEINDRLADPPVVDVAVSRRMGLFVVGRLAERHDIVVRLHPPDAGQGLVASVVVPPAHLTLDADGDTDVDVPAQVGVGDAADDNDLFSSSGFGALDRPSPRQRDPQDAEQEVAASSGAETEPAADGRPPHRAPQRERIENGKPAENGADQGAARLSAADVAEAAAPTGPVETATLGTEPARPSESAQPVDPPAAESQPTDHGPRPADDEDPLTGPLPLVAEQTVDGKSGHPEDEPIFEEMVSAWFRERRNVPVPHGEDPELAAEPETQPDQPAAHAEPQQRPRDPSPASDDVATPPVGTVGAQPASAARPTASGPGDPAVEHIDEPDADRAAVSAANGGHARGAEPAVEWRSAADEGWQAAQAVDSLSTPEVTAAGLPKRRPREHLVPGAAGDGWAAQTAGNRGPARSADTVRGRLSRYQRGLREGRDARGQGAGRPAPHGPDESGEEQE